MNKKIIALLMTVIIVVSLFASCNPAVKPINVKNSREGLEKLDLSGDSDVEIISSGNLSISVNPSTTAVTITDVKNNTQWRTNPPLEEIGKVQNEEGRKRLSSQLSVTYRNKENKEQVMNNYDLCIARGQYEFYKIDNGLKVIYNIGDYNQVLIPEALTQARYENEIINKCNDEQKKWIDIGYSLIILDELKSQKKKDEYLSKYPILKSTNLYIKKEKISKSIQEKLSNSFQEIGYSSDDLKKDNELIGLEKEEDRRIYFSIPIEYRLDNNDLVISIPIDEVDYNPECKLSNIIVLESFAATDSEDGYSLIPDGSGSLVRFNNGKQTSTPVPVSIYGTDDSIFMREEIQISQKAHFPVYGMKNGNKSFLAIMEDGAANANVIANSARDFLPYNQIYTEYAFLHNNTLPMKGSKSYSLQVFEKMPYQGNFSTRYKFLYNENSDYMGMANCYRDYLIDKEILSNKKNDSSIPMLIELIGAIDKIEVKAGIPRDSEVSLTTFNQAQNIISKLKKDGVDNLKIKYSGWYSGGMRQRYPTKLDVENVLGSKKDFLKLMDYSKNQNVDIYPAINIQYINDEYDGVFERFNHYTDGAKFIIREYAFRDTLYAPLYMRFDEEGRSYIVSPIKFKKQMTDYLKSTDKNDINNVSFETLGCQLNSDYNTNKNFTCRQDALKLQQEVLEMTAKQNKIMINGCNDYALKYADFIANMPTDSSRYYYADESIPFMQIVLHGYVDYTSKPLNLSGDFTKDLLKTIECGAAPSFTWFYEENFKVMNSKYSRYYTSNYETWYDKAVSLFKEFNENFGDISNSLIINHKVLKPDVTVTEYDNGTKIYVNCSLSDVTVEGVTVKAENYKVVKGGVK